MISMSGTCLLMQPIVLSYSAYCLTQAHRASPFRPPLHRASILGFFQPHLRFFASQVSWTIHSLGIYRSNLAAMDCQDHRW